MKTHSFTLIEILIVLVIIGIVASLAIFQYQKFARRAQEAEAQRILRAVSDAVWAYYIEKGNFPESDERLSAPPPNNVPEMPYSWHPTIPPSKYYMYIYLFGGLPLYGLCVATPIQSADVYMIGYKKEAPTENQQAQQMDNEWYRYYLKYQKGIAVWHW